MEARSGVRVVCPCVLVKDACMCVCMYVYMCVYTHRRDGHSSPLGGTRALLRHAGREINMWRLRVRVIRGGSEYVLYVEAQSTCYTWRLRVRVIRPYVLVKDAYVCVCVSMYVYIYVCMYTNTCTHMYNTDLAIYFAL